MTDSTKCACGDPQQAAFYVNGVIGRGTVATGTQTEELSEFRCARHNLTRKQYSAMLRKVVDEHTAFYGAWQVLEFRSRKLERLR